MNKLVTSCALVLCFGGLVTTSIASACEVGYDSLQFGGYARNVQKTAVGCTFQVELNSNVSVPKVEMSCPLYPGEVGTLIFKDPSCQTFEGDILSGVMSLNRATGETKID